MVRTVCLNEDKHSVTILRSLRQMKQEDDLCDFTIRVESNEFHAHRVIIAAGSPYFKAMLKHHTKECQEGKVEMKNVDAECVKSCIDFLYSGKFDIPVGKTGKLLHVAIMIQLDDVKEAICNILDNEVSAENFYQTRRIAEMYQLSTIVIKCKVYFEGNFMAISVQPEFQNEKKSHLINILKSKNMKLSEDEKLAASLRWVGNHPDKKEELFELLKCIKLKEVSSSYVRDLLRNHPVISNDLLLYKLMSDPLLGCAENGSNEKKGQNEELLLIFDWDADCLRSYNPTAESVTKFHDEGFKHLGHLTAVSMDSYIYVLCEDKSVHRLNFKDKNSKWERMQDMIADHGTFPPSVSFSASLFVIGAYGGQCRSSPVVVEKFDVVANEWLRLKDKPTEVHGPTLVSLDDSIYCIGGSVGSVHLDTLCTFTPSTSQWADLEPMEIARGGCSAVAVEQKIFVIGGYCNSGDTNRVECYDVASKQWASLSPMIGFHGLSVAHHFDGGIFSVPRIDPLIDIEKYDIANDRWSKVAFKSTFEVYDCLHIKI